MMTYTAPESTEAQRAAAELYGYDPDARLGLASKRRPLWDFSATHPLASAAVIHDHKTLRILTREEREEVDGNFERDCLLLTDAMEPGIRREEYGLITVLFADIVYAYSALGLNESTTDRTTPESLIDNNAQMFEAMRFVNQAARCRGKEIPYAEAEK